MFLTLEDPRAKVQGSRDPLGLQPIWSRFGREVVTNLTTVSRAVRGFTVTLLARYFGELLLDDGRAAEEDVVPIFLRLEQVAAYRRGKTRSDMIETLMLTISEEFFSEKWPAELGTCNSSARLRNVAVAHTHKEA